MNIRTFILSTLMVLLLPLGGAPLSAHAATSVTPKLEVSGWIPYWRTATGTTDVLPHLSQLTEVNPFGYTVKSDATLYDALKVQDPAWQNLFASAKAQHVRVVPTVMWSDTNQIHTILSNATTRQALEENITAAVIANGFDGIDIDFEGKKAEDINNFSTFLKGLYQRMGNKWVMCTIEARTPVSSRYLSTPPSDAAVYANDFKAMNKYCDRVRFMTYDQQSVDLRLNAAAGKNLYSPVADPAWVEKTITLAAKDIRKSKIVIGVATYGYEYDVTPYADGSGYMYDLLYSFNPRYATEKAASLGIAPVRNLAGELSFTYNATSTAQTPAASDMTPAGTLGANSAAAAALAYASATQTQNTFRMMWWSDPQAIADKIALAKKLGIRGVAVFKMDGGEDQGIWNVLPKR